MAFAVAEEILLEKDNKAMPDGAWREIRIVT